MQCPYCKKNLEKIVIQLQVQGQKLRPSIVLDVSARPLFEENGISNIAKSTILPDGVFIVLRQKASAMREFRKKQNPRDIRHRGFVLALPIFPGRLQPSIVGRSELNFRVRDGNGWTLALISTNLSAQQCSVMPTHVQLLAP